jgi:hypothetical protein
MVVGRYRVLAVPRFIYLVNLCFANSINHFASPLRFEISTVPHLKCPP